MFKGYFKYQPLPVQVFAFGGLWFLLQLIYFFLMPYIIRITTGTDMSIAEVLHGSVPSALMWMNLVYQVFFFIIPVLLYAYLWSPRPMSALGYKTPTNRQVFLSLVIGVVFVFIFPVLGTLLTQIEIGDWADSLQAQRKQMEAVYFQDRTVVGLLRNLFLLALIPAFAEELFFRGVLMRFANSVFKQPIISIGVTAAIFAFMHFSVYNFLPIFFAGFLLGYIYYRTGNLWLSTLVHFAYNAVQVYVQFASPESESSLERQTAMLFGILLVATVLAAVLIKRLTAVSQSLPKDWSMKALPVPVSVSDEINDIGGK